MISAGKCEFINVNKVSALMLSISAAKRTVMYGWLSPVGGWGGS